MEYNKLKSKIEKVKRWFSRWKHEHLSRQWRLRITNLANRNTLHNQHTTTTNDLQHQGRNATIHSIQSHQIRPLYRNFPSMFPSSALPASLPSTSQILTPTGLLQNTSILLSRKPQTLTSRPHPSLPITTSATSLLPHSPRSVRSVFHSTTLQYHPQTCVWGFGM